MKFITLLLRFYKNSSFLIFLIIIMHYNINVTNNSILVTSNFERTDNIFYVIPIIYSSNNLIFK